MTITESMPRLVYWNLKFVSAFLTIGHDTSVRKNHKTYSVLTNFPPKHSCNCMTQYPARISSHMNLATGRFPRRYGRLTRFITQFRFKKILDSPISVRTDFNPSAPRITESQPVLFFHFQIALRFWFLYCSFSVYFIGRVSNQILWFWDISDSNRCGILSNSLRMEWRWLAKFLFQTRHV